MKKLAKLTAVFTVICMALALVACSHSGREYDWKNPDGGSKDPEPNEVLTLTNEWDGTYVFYDDGTFDYKESGSEEVTLKGNYKGDPSKDEELKLSVTSGYWNGAWSAPDNGYGIYFVIEGDSFIGYDWWMEDDKEVKDEKNPKTFTKVEEEKEPETEGGTTPENPEDTEGGSGGGDTGSNPGGDEDPQIILSYTDSWKGGDTWNAGSNVFTLYDDYTYTLKKYDGEDITSDSQKGTWEKTESGYKLIAVYYWDTSKNDWDVSSGSYGYNLTVDNGNVTGYVAWY